MANSRDQGEVQEQCATHEFGRRGWGLPGRWWRGWSWRARPTPWWWWYGWAGRIRTGVESVGAGHRGSIWAGVGAGGGPWTWGRPSPSWRRTAPGELPGARGGGDLGALGAPREPLHPGLRGSGGVAHRPRRPEHGGDAVAGHLAEHGQDRHPGGGGSRSGQGSVRPPGADRNR